ncbi:hypothetical protein B0O99DRAFT_113442 [Bisporella sp. PMI_857]|nr:hypothetical protein B0O99DRAFT_113442 [Bisporella sp. PMI_857]
MEWAALAWRFEQLMESKSCPDTSPCVSTGLKSSNLTTTVLLLPYLLLPCVEFTRRNSRFLQRLQNAEFASWRGDFNPDSSEKNCVTEILKQQNTRTFHRVHKNPFGLFQVAVWWVSFSSASDPYLMNESLPLTGMDYSSPYLSSAGSFSIQGGVHRSMFRLEIGPRSACFMRGDQLPARPSGPRFANHRIFDIPVGVYGLHARQTCLDILLRETYLMNLI